MTGVRQPFAVAAAGTAALGALLAAWALVRIRDDLHGYEALSPVEVAFLVVAAVLAGVATLLLTRYAMAPKPGPGWAVGAIVLLVVAGLLGGSAAWYLPYFAALLAGCALAAGEPLPPPDPDDDRMSRPMPRGDGR